MRTETHESLEKEISSALNRHCAENESNTPDFLLAAYLLTCLDAFNKAVRSREGWYGRDPDTGPGKIGESEI